MIHLLAAHASITAAASNYHHQRSVNASIGDLILGVALLIAGAAIQVINRRRARTGQAPIASNRRAPNGARRLHPPTMMIGGAVLTALGITALLLLTYLH